MLKVLSMESRQHVVPSLCGVVTPTTNPGGPPARGSVKNPLSHALPARGGKSRYPTYPNLLI